jgi:hypothetical protein
MHKTLLRREDSFGILWGGGLGDILVLRPLLMALESALAQPPYLLTTATHLSGLFEQLDLRTRLRILPQAPAAALAELRRLDLKFDWLYLGPHPRIKTRMLAHMMRPRRIWGRRHAAVGPFLSEQIRADIDAFGLTLPGSIHEPYGGRWPASLPPPGLHRDYLLLHPGAKGRWQTKLWQDERWAEFMARLLGESEVDLMLVGVPEESPHLKMLQAHQAVALRQRVSIRTDLPLLELAQHIAGSRGVICHNSGVMHMAAMLGKPTLVLTGSSPLYWRPPYPHVVNLTSGACNLACDQYRCPVPFFNARCIRELSVTDVMGAVSKMGMIG